MPAPMAKPQREGKYPLRLVGWVEVRNPTSSLGFALRARDANVPQPNRQRNGEGIAQRDRKFPLSALVP
jgi:hypothetical protein